MISWVPDAALIEAIIWKCDDVLHSNEYLISQQLNAALIEAIARDQVDVLHSNEQLFV